MPGCHYGRILRAPGAVAVRIHLKHIHQLCPRIPTLVINSQNRSICDNIVEQVMGYFPPFPDPGYKIGSQGCMRTGAFQPYQVCTR
jgi:hypothetical protein